MFKGKKILCVIPARGGSKGVPRKNIRPLAGKPLIAWTCEFAKSFDFIDEIVVSTDDNEIAQTAEKFGVRAPFRRPADISGDLIGDIEVLQHALQEMEKQRASRFDAVIMLQPTSPVRQKEDLLGCLEKVVSEGFAAAWTMTELDKKHHPLKQLTLGADGRFVHYDPQGKKIIARQQLSPTYIRNGVCYVMSRQAIAESASLDGGNLGGVTVKHPIANIDSLDDFAEAEKLLSAVKE
jgi:CMP-N,N'-diacetyllegionaminic acid synthase